MQQDAIGTDPVTLETERAPATDAFERVQTRPPSPAPIRRRFSLPRLGALALLGALGAVAVLVWTGDADESTDLMVRLGRSADSFRPELVTIDAEAAERYVLDAFGWPVEAPALPELQLVGVGEATIAQTQDVAVDVPAFRYDAADGSAVVVYVYDYVLLDQTTGLASLPDPVYARLAEESPVDVRRQGGLSFVTWRRRAVLYTAVTDDEERAESIALSVAG